MRNPLLDPIFLKQIDKDNQKEIYAKIVSLTRDELPIEAIEGRVTQGTININGASAVTRTCNLTIVATEVNISDIYWGLTNKFKLEIGLRNNVDSSYDDIIWFPQGVYIITTFKTTFDNKKYNVQISGQDKMCLLTGDVSGVIPIATDFAYEEEVLEDGSISKNYIPIKRMIREMIHSYGNEPFHNIIINDMDEMALEQLDYIGDNNVYIFRTEDGQYQNLVFDGDITRYDKQTNKPIKINDDKKIIYYSLSRNADNRNATWVRAEPKTSSPAYQIIKCLPGEVSGYKMIDLIWPKKEGLIAKPGETIKSVLDKICKEFGEFEYFYDLDGRFVFQKKLTYVNVSWNNMISPEQDETYTESQKFVSQHSYDFSDTTLIQSFSNNPDFKKLKNDFSIWGKKRNPYGNSSGGGGGKSGSNANDPLAIHLRYAIHEKPTEYTDYQGKTWYAGTRLEITFDPDIGIVTEVKDNIVDWRELIYLMAVDFLAHNHDDDFYVRIARNNPQYHDGRTGYEQYYTDMLQFWRQLYDPYSKDSLTYFVGTLSESEAGNFGWHRDTVDDPSTLKFWIDFLDPQGGELSKYSVSAIGSRAMAVNEDSIKNIVHKEIPTLIYITPTKYKEYSEINALLDGYIYVQIPESFEEFFQRSTRGKTAYDKLDDLLYTNAYVNEKITIKGVPIYYLQPNTKISVHDESSKIYGDYIINKISLTLGHKGTMTISASKAPVRLY